MTLSDKKKYVLIFSLIVFADQISKYMIKSAFALDPYRVITVIDQFFFIRYVKNQGAVWGILSNSPHSFMPKLITGLSLIALVAIGVFFLKLKPSCRIELTALSFIVGGALGNIIDRLWQGFVVDFIDVLIVNYHWPTFNIADSFISTGVVLLIISIWRGKCTQF